MRLLMTAMLVGSSLQPALAAPAAPPPVVRTGSPDAVQQQFERLGTWLQRINEAVMIADAGVGDLGNKIQTLFPHGADRATLRANSVRLRALVQEARAQVLRSQQALAAIPPLESPIAAANGLDPAKVLAEVRAQTTEMLQYLADCEAFAVAEEKNDEPAIRESAPKMMRGAATLLDGRVLVYSNRQTSIPSDRSANRAMGVIVNLYQAMSLAFHSWMRARLDGQPDEAARELRTQFLTLALETETVVRQGRDIASHEQAALDAEMKRAKGNRTVLDVDMRASHVVASEERIFAIGEQLAVWLRGHAAITGEQLAAQHEPELLEALTPVEEQLLAATRAEADALANPSR